MELLQYPRGTTTTINVDKLESERTDRDAYGEERDPLASVRSGDDLEEDSSKVSDFLYMSNFNRDQLCKEIDVQNFDSSYNDSAIRQESYEPHYGERAPKISNFLGMASNSGSS